MSATATAVAVVEAPSAAPAVAPDTTHVRESVLGALEAANLHSIAVLLENAVAYFTTKINQNYKDASSFVKRAWAHQMLGNLDQALNYALFQ